MKTLFEFSLLQQPQPFGISAFAGGHYLVTADVNDPVAVLLPPRLALPMPRTFLRIRITASGIGQALIKGGSPDGQHYYPAFPDTSYARVNIVDIVDLHAFLNTLPSSSVIAQSHDLPLPFRFRRGNGA